jgi:creatinine amidohydrolase/Fe(II)-dependent formamide hydrolase-like protein
MRVGEMTYEGIRRCVASNAIEVVPAGCTEQQGPSRGLACPSTGRTPTANSPATRPGVTGTRVYANADLGVRLWFHLVNEVTRRFRTLAQPTITKTTTDHETDTPRAASHSQP